MEGFIAQVYAPRFDRIIKQSRLFKKRKEAEKEVEKYKKESDECWKGSVLYQPGREFKVIKFNKNVSVPSKSEVDDNSLIVGLEEGKLLKLARTDHIWRNGGCLIEDLPIICRMEN
jgi:hypothetical protein